MDNPGFGRLRDAFKKFVTEQATGEVGARAVRTLAAGGKALVDKALEEFPKDIVKGIASDFYKFLLSDEVAEGASLAVRSFDEEKIKATLLEVSVLLQDDETATMFAKGFRLGLKKSNNDDIEGMVDYILAGRPVAVRWIAKAFFENAKPYIDEMRGASTEQITQKIKDLAETLPVDTIASQVADYTREVTPARVSKMMQDFVAKQPTPDAVAEIAEGVGKVASVRLDDMSKAPTLEDADKVLKTMASEANAVIKRVVVKDDVVKKNEAAAKKAAKRRDGKGFWRF